VIDEFLPDRGLSTECRSLPVIWRTQLPDEDDTVITAHLAATFAGFPVYVHTIEHADGVVLVDTGMIARVRR